MQHRWAALAFVLALCAIPTKSAAGQQADQQPRGRKLGTLGQNYPNPFNPQTHIPFSIDCDGSGAQRTVSLNVYNVLGQLVTVPVLEGEVGMGQPLRSITVPCGSYVAFWDGKVLKTGREAASGVYLYELVIDGQRQTKKAFVAK